MKKTLLRAVLAVTLCAHFATPCLAQSEPAQQAVRQAEQLLKQRSYSQAISLLNTALGTTAADIDQAELLLILAQATERMAAAQEEKTVESVSKSRLAAVALDDQVVALTGATPAQKMEALKHAVLQLMVEGRRDEANQRRKSLLAMTELPPKARADLLQELAGQTEDKDEAIGYLEQAGALPGLSPTERAFILLKTGQTLIQAEQLEAAAKSYQAVEGMADLQPGWHTAAGLGLTEIDLATGRVKPASERIRSLVSQHAKKDVTQYTVLTLGKKFREAKDPETFIVLMEYLSQSPPDSGNQTENALLELADYYALQKQNDKAHRALQKLPFSRRAVIKDLDLYHEQGQADQLAQRFDQIVSLIKEERSAQPNDNLHNLWQHLPRLASVYVRAYAQPKTKKAAVSLLKTALEFYPSNTPQGKEILKEMTRIEGL